jgi:hypothetical protein
MAAEREHRVHAPSRPDAIVAGQPRPRHRPRPLVAPRAELGQLRLDLSTIGIERAAQLALRLLDIAQRVLTLGDGVTEIAHTMIDVVELPLRLTDHLPRLVELRGGGGRLACGGHGVELGLIALLELSILVEPSPHVPLAPLFRLDCLTSLIERMHSALLLLDHGLEPRHERREPFLEGMDLDVVCLHREQRRYVWMHSGFSLGILVLDTFMTP